MRSSRMVRWVPTVFGVQLVLVGIACAETQDASKATDNRGDSKQASQVDPSGTWKWEYKFNDNTAEFTVKLDWDGKKLGGTYTAFDRTSDIEDAKLEKNHLSFVVKREFNGDELVVHFDGTAKPDAINGTIKLTLRNEPREFEWNAKRAVQIDDVLGTWQLKVETPSGVIEPRLTIRKDGDALRGTSVSSTFGELEAQDLRLKDNQLSWEVAVPGGDGEFHVKYHGKPRGNTMDGTNEFTFGDNKVTMKFTGKRTPPDEAQKDRKAVGAKPSGETPASAAASSDRK